jgi:hypothetical protein
MSGAFRCMSRQPAKRRFHMLAAGCETFQPRSGTVDARFPRRIMVAVQCFQAAAGTALAVLTAADMTPALLLTVAFDRLRQKPFKAWPRT